MAYFAPMNAQDSQPLAMAAAAAPATAQAGFTALEWSVIRLARVDRLWTIRPSGPILRFWNRLLGRANPQLASPRLETLRRVSVLSWHFGFTIPGEDVADFLSAGFSADQYELLVSSVTNWSRPEPALQQTKVLA